MTYSTTTVTIDYNTDALQFASEQEYMTFLQALGRMVIYAMQNTDERTNTLTALSIARDKEITGVYYHTPQMGAVEAALDQAKTASAAARKPFVMGAVPHHEDDASPDVVTRFSYHS